MKKTSAPLPDTGLRTSFGTDGAIREADPTKSSIEGMSPYAAWRIGTLFTNGGIKYKDFRNWEKGMNVMRFVGAILRHTFQYVARDRREDHLAAIAWNAMCIMHFEEVGATSGKTFEELDDRPRWGSPRQPCPSLEKTGSLGGKTVRGRPKR